MESTPILQFVTGLLIFGEAVVLLISAKAFKKIPPEWLTVLNRFILLSDIAVGGVILNYVLQGTAAYVGWFVALGLLTHIYRAAEFYMKRKNLFCFNNPLFVVNMIKLLGLLVMIKEFI